MKTKLVFGTFLSLFISTLSFAQVLDDYEDSPAARVEQAREDFITERLGLSDEEADPFWDVFYEFKDKQQKIKKQYKPSRPINRMTEEEADQFILARFEMEEKLLKLKKEYYQKFQTIISPKKVALFTKAEKEFRKEVLRRFKENRRRRRGKRKD